VSQTTKLFFFVTGEQRQP